MKNLIKWMLEAISHIKNRGEIVPSRCVACGMVYNANSEDGEFLDSYDYRQDELPEETLCGSCEDYYTKEISPLDYL